MPKAIVVAGPPGSGKSKMFPAGKFRLGRRAVDRFNIDERAADLNGGSFHGIPEDVRRQAIRDLVEFVSTHISAGRSYVVETTLRDLSSVRQAEQAKKAGFKIEMFYVCTRDPEENVRRVRVRGHGSGHSAPESVLRETFARSLQNLPEAFLRFDRVELLDNSRQASPQGTPEAEILAVVTRGRLKVRSKPLPAWADVALRAAGFQTRSGRGR